MLQSLTQYCSSPSDYLLARFQPRPSVPCPPGEHVDRIDAKRTGGKVNKAKMIRPAGPGEERVADLLDDDQLSDAVPDGRYRRFSEISALRTASDCSRQNVPVSIAAQPSELVHRAD